MAWFLLGLLTGLVIWLGGWLRQKARLAQEIRELYPEQWNSSSLRPFRVSRLIATQKQLNQSLQNQLNVSQYLLHIAPIGFLQVDEENQLMFCNDRACQLLHLEQSKPEKPRLLLEVVRSYELDDLIEQTRHAQKNCQSEWLFHPVDADFAKLTRQQSQTLRGYGVPLSRGWVGIFLESREEAIMLTRQRDRWISDVAHELKTPLTSIRLVAETLQSRLDPPAREWVERLLREAIRLSNLVQDLLDLNQLQAQPNTQLVFKTIDLAKLVQSAWLSLEPLAQEKQIQLDYVGPEQLLTQADEARLHRVLLNLLDNSIKYSPPHQHVRVEVGLSPSQPDSDGQQVHIQIIDAGVGFPDDALPFVFERFYRADPSRTRGISEFNAPTKLGTSPKSGDSSNLLPGKQLGQMPMEFTQFNNGNGLGLAIVHQIVDAHQGSVIASNHPETGGAWLQVFLPWRPPQ